MKRDVMGELRNGRPERPVQVKSRFQHKYTVQAARRGDLAVGIVIVTICAVPDVLKNHRGLPNNGAER